MIIAVAVVIATPAAFSVATVALAVAIAIITTFFAVAAVTAEGLLKIILQD